MNSITPKWHAETLRNQNISFQLKNETLTETELTTLVPGVSHHFQISEIKIYKTYEGYRTQFCCFEAQRASQKTEIESDPNFLHSKYCLGL